MQSSVVALALVFAAAALAGCVTFQEEAHDPLRVLGTDGHLVYGYNPSGGHGRPMEGPGFAEFSFAAQQAFAYGFVHASSDATDVHLNQTSAPDFTDGSSVLRDVVVHGDTGLGDPRLPRMHAEAAAWGLVVLDKGEQAAPFEFAPGRSQWDAEVLLITHGIRTADPHLGRGVIRTADGEGVWSPDRPQDVYYEDGVRELHAILRSRQSPEELMAGPLTSHSDSLIPAGGQSHRTFTSFHPDATAKFSLRVEAATEIDMVATDAKARLYDKDDALVATLTAGGVAQAIVETATDVELPAAGEYRIVLAGRGPGTHAEATLTYTMDHLVIHVWWDVVSTGQEADRRMGDPDLWWNQRIAELRA